MQGSPSKNKHYIKKREEILGWNRNFVLHSMCNTKCRNYTAHDFRKVSLKQGSR